MIDDSNVPLNCADKSVVHDFGCTEDELCVRGANSLFSIKITTYMIGDFGLCARAPCTVRPCLCIRAMTEFTKRHDGIVFGCERRMSSDFF